MALIDVVWAQLERYEKDFVTEVSFLGHMATMHSVHIAKTGS